MKLILEMTLVVLVRTVVELIKAINRYNGYAAEQREQQQLKMARPRAKPFRRADLINISCTITKLSSYQYRSIYLLHCSLDLYPVSTSTAQSIHHYIFARVIMAIEMHY